MQMICGPFFILAFNLTLTLLRSRKLCPSCTGDETESAGRLHYFKRPCAVRAWQSQHINKYLLTLQNVCSWEMVRPCQRCIFPNPSQLSCWPYMNHPTELCPPLAQMPMVMLALLFIYLSIWKMTTKTVFYYRALVWAVPASHTHNL